MRLALRYLGHREDSSSEYSTRTMGSLTVGHELVVPSEGLMLGRSSTAGLQIPSGRVARHHVRIVPRGDGLMVEDLGSTNGTQLHGSDAAEGQLNLGDRLTLADEFDFEVVAHAT